LRGGSAGLGGKGGGGASSHGALVEWATGDGNRVHSTLVGAPRGVLGLFVRVEATPPASSAASAHHRKPSTLSFDGAAVAVVRLSPLGPAASPECSWDVRVPQAWLRLPFSLHGACIADEPLAMPHAAAAPGASMGLAQQLAQSPAPSTTASLRALSCVYASALAMHASLIGVRAALLSWPPGVRFSVDAVGGPRVLLSLARLVLRQEGPAPAALLLLDELGSEVDAALVAALQAALLARPETLLAIEHREAAVRSAGFTHVLLVGERGGPAGARLLGIAEARALLFGGGGGGSDRHSS